MRYLYPGFLALVGLVCVLVLVRRRSRISSPHPRRAVAWRLALGVGLPAATAIFSVDIFGALFILELPYLLAVDLIAVWLVSRVIAHLWTAPGLRLGLAVGIAVPLMFACEIGSRDIGTYAYLLRHHSAYQRVLEHVRRSPGRAAGTFDGVEYRVEIGPTRVIFPWPGGLLDNWYGVVHDPSGGVTRAPQDEAIRELFGGDIIGVRHLWGPWYLCSFT